MKSKQPDWVLVLFHISGIPLYIYVYIYYFFVVALVHVSFLSHKIHHELYCSDIEVRTMKFALQ